jgi:hypothetical protein
MDDLAKLWGKFSLEEKESAGVSLDTPELDPLVKRGRTCLVGKLKSERIVPKEFYKSPLVRAWRPTGSLSFNVIGRNMFVVEFEHEWDKTRIMEGRPWLFDGHLVSLAEFDGLTPPAKINFNHDSFLVRMYNLPLACMGRNTGQKIGESVGVVEEVDIYDEEAGWGEYLRVKIKIDLHKPLARGRMLHLQNQSTWVAFQYEKLPKLCYQCGVVMHDRVGCDLIGSRMKTGEDDSQPYGPWLRVVFPQRRFVGGEARFRRTNSDGIFTGHPERERPSYPSNAARSSTPVAGGWTSGDVDGGVCEIPSGGDGSQARNPSSLWKETVTESLPTLQAENHADEISVDVTASCNGKSLKGKEPLSESGVDCGGDIMRRLNKEKNLKYLGPWDMGQGRMVYEGVEETSSLLHLAKDPVDHTYLPRGLFSNTQRDPKSPQGSEKETHVLEDVELSADSNIQMLGDQLATGSVRSWKKRVRKTQTVSAPARLKEAKVGKRKGDKQLEGRDRGRQKKGKLSWAPKTAVTTNQAEAGHQPSPSQ